MSLRKHLGEEILDRRKVLMSITEIVYAIHVGVS